MAIALRVRQSVLVVSGGAQRGGTSLLDLARAECDAPAEGNYKTNRALVLLTEGVKADLPPVGLDALDQARRVWCDRSDVASLLDDYSVRCWMYLEQKNSSSVVIVDREDHAVRLLLCCLYSYTEDDELLLSVEFALDMLHWLAGPDAQIAAVVDEVTTA